MRVSKLAAGALMAAALVTPALAATAAQAAPPPITTMDWVQEGPFATSSACEHRRAFWDQLDGRSHYCVFYDGVHGGNARGYWIYTRG
jgi:opacity protein-like surface antigen